MHKVRPIFTAVFVTNLGFGVCFALLMILIFTTYSTSWQEEIWWLSYGSAPSLIVSLVFTVLLLFWWSLACWVPSAIAGNPPHSIEKVVLTGVHILQFAIAAVLWVAWDSVEIENYHRYGDVPRAENFLRSSQERLPRGLGEPSLRSVSLYQAYGVWRVSEVDPSRGLKPLPRATSYLAFWRNGRYEFLNSDYTVIAAGDYRFSDWSSQPTRENPRPLPGRDLYLFADNGGDYYGEVEKSRTANDGFNLSFSFGTKVIERIEEHYELSEPLVFRLHGRKLVYSSHPVPLTADYPFYDERRRHDSAGYRINPDALYP